MDRLIDCTSIIAGRMELSLEYTETFIEMYIKDGPGPVMVRITLCPDVTLVRIAPLSSDCSCRMLKAREIVKIKYISNLKSLGSLDPSRIRQFLPFALSHFIKNL